MGRGTDPQADPLGEPFQNMSSSCFLRISNFDKKTDFSENCDNFAILEGRPMAQSVGSTAERSPRGMREAPLGLTKPSNKATKPYKPYKPEVAESNTALRPQGGAPYLIASRIPPGRVVFQREEQCHFSFLFVGFPGG